MNVEKEKIEEKIEILIQEFSSNPHKFLTEEDLRSYLYHLLLGDFGGSENGSKSIPLHTEIRWYGKSGKLRLRSDIVIIDVSTLKTENSSSFKLPSKGYWFNVPKIIIEIKLRRLNSESDNTFLNRIGNDRAKIKKLDMELVDKLHSFLIIFDKKKDIKPKLENSNKRTEYYVYPYEENGD